MRIRGVLCVCALAAAFATALFGPGSKSEAVTTRATMVRVVDGDTVEVELANGKRRSVRLIGIDTPETVRPGTPIECGGPAASKRLRRFEGASVRLISDPTQDGVDRYGRLLRYVVTTERVDLGKSQIGAGLASVYIYDAPFRRLDTYERQAQMAKAAGRGVWGDCGGDFHKPRLAGD